MPHLNVFGERICYCVICFSMLNPRIEWVWFIKIKHYLQDIISKLYRPRRFSGASQWLNLMRHLLGLFEAIQKEWRGKSIKHHELYQLEINRGLKLQRAPRIEIIYDTDVVLTMKQKNIILYKLFINEKSITNHFNLVAFFGGCGRKIRATKKGSKFNTTKSTRLARYV